MKSGIDRNLGDDGLGNLGTQAVCIGGRSCRTGGLSRCRQGWNNRSASQPDPRRLLSSGFFGLFSCYFLILFSINLVYCNENIEFINGLFLFIHQEPDTLILSRLIGCLHFNDNGVALTGVYIRFQCVRYGFPRSDPIAPIINNGIIFIPGRGTRIFNMPDHIKTVIFG